MSKKTHNCKMNQNPHNQSSVILLLVGRWIIVVIGRWIIVVVGRWIIVVVGSCFGRWIIDHSRD